MFGRRPTPSSEQRRILPDVFSAVFFCVICVVGSSWKRGGAEAFGYPQRGERTEWKRMFSEDWFFHAWSTVSRSPCSKIDSEVDVFCFSISKTRSGYLSVEACVGVCMHWVDQSSLQVKLFSFPTTEQNRFVWICWSYFAEQITSRIDTVPQEVPIAVILLTSVSNKN